MNIGCDILSVVLIHSTSSTQTTCTRSTRTIRITHGVCWTEDRLMEVQLNHQRNHSSDNLFKRFPMGNLMETGSKLIHEGLEPENEGLEPENHHPLKPKII